MESPLFLPTLRTDHELRKFSPSLQRVILSNAKDLLLRRPKQILHFIQDDILEATIAMEFMEKHDRQLTIGRFVDRLAVVKGVKKFILAGRAQPANANELQIEQGEQNYLGHRPEFRNGARCRCINSDSLRTQEVIR